MARMTAADQAVADDLAGRIETLAHLRAQAAALGARMVAAKGEYDSGRISLAEELRLVRGIEREMGAIETRMHDLARDQHAPPMPHIPR